ncbi:MAG: type I secretion system permease/ATPase [Rhizobiaceae bacterium]|nr:type I secretion system permease/ATPase [Rhizobiaceae bacterium]MCV0405607.1 type I secretion system permease/ATPase [Rhizobiaceae bacterium]
MKRTGETNVSTRRPQEIHSVFLSARGYFVTAALFSLGINLLYLAAPLYMLQVYDRVVSSGSVTTLVMLTVALLLAFMALAALDIVRGRVLARAGVRLDRQLAGRVVAATLERTGSAGSQPLRDFDTFRQFVGGAGISAVFDLPWAPVYILVLYVLHPWLGLFALCSAIILGFMALLNEWFVRGPQKEANDAAMRNYGFTEMSLRNAEVVQAMGMTGGLLKRWSRDRDRHIARQVEAADRSGTMTSLIKFLRMAMQSLILGLGAYLVIERMASAGIMFAGMLLLGRALQPVEQVVGNWRNIVSARAAWRRVRDLLAATPPRAPSLNLPRPRGALSVEGLTYAASGNPKPILRNVSFSLDAGEVVGVIGPSGAGKSTLARQVVGVLSPMTGAVRLDGADVARWPRESLGRYLGYLPQDIELFADTVAANISRFQENADAAVIEAAQLAGVHDMILRLPDGYDTRIGEGGAGISGGMRQRLGLARAVFGNPSLVILDEPNSNLDVEGDNALADCIGLLKERGTTVIVISHRMGTLGAVDKILALRDGMVLAFGPRNEVVSKLTRPVSADTARRAPSTKPDVLPDQSVDDEEAPADAATGHAR